MGAGRDRAGIERDLLLLVVIYLGPGLQAARPPSPTPSKNQPPCACVALRAGLTSIRKGNPMTKQQPIQADTIIAVILQIPLEMLYISDLNPRKAVSEAHIESLGDSIERFGLIHNLAGLVDEDGKVGIVAGGCSFRAIQMIAERSKTHPFTSVPVKLAADTVEAEDWASTKNAAREDMTPVDEIRAFGRMKSRGGTVPEITLAFAVTEARVHQRLALAELPEPVLDSLAAEEISLGTAKAFTLSDDEALTLSSFRSGEGQVVSESAIRNALHPDAIKATDRRTKLVGIEAYEAEGGTVTGDLFSDEVFLASPALLDRLFTEKLDAALADLIEIQGLAWAEARPEAWLNYYELDQMQLACLYPVEGDLTEEETQEHDELADLANGGVLDEVGEARVAELQVAFLAKRELVLDLLGFGLSEASGSFESVFGIRLDRPMNVPSVVNGFDRDPRLEHGIDASEYRQKGTRVGDLSEAFAVFRNTGKKARNTQITEAIARALPHRAGGEEFFGLIADEAGADIRKHWTPTAENFFSRVSAGHLVELLCELLDCDARGERVASFAKLKKAKEAEKMEKLVSEPTTQKLVGLTSEQKAKLDNWVPDCT